MKINETNVLAEGIWKNLSDRITSVFIDVLHQSTTSATVNDEIINDETEELVKVKHKPITFFQAWLLPGVAMVTKKNRLKLILLALKRELFCLVFDMLCLFETSEL